MTVSERQILTPGEPAPQVATPVVDAPVRRKPGPKSRAEREAEAAAGGAGQPPDDLAEFESDDLPPAPVAQPFSPEQQAIVAKMIADAVRASRSSQDPATAAKLAAAANNTAQLPSQDAARLMCDDAVARGQRPRPILTPDGWYVHPESARTKDAGVANLGG